MKRRKGRSKRDGELQSWCFANRAFINSRLVIDTKVLDIRCIAPLLRVRSCSSLFSCFPNTNIHRHEGWGSPYSLIQIHGCSDPPLPLPSPNIHQLHHSGNHTLLILFIYPSAHPPSSNKHPSSPPSRHTSPNQQPPPQFRPNRVSNTAPDP